MAEEVSWADARSGDGEPVESDGEDEDQDGSEGEVGERQAGEREQAESAVGPAVAAGCGDNASGNSEADADEHGCNRERQRVRKMLEDEVEDGVVKAEGLAEVSVSDATPVAEILRVEWGVEAVGVTQDGEVGGGGAVAEHLDDGVSGNDVDEEEDDGDDQPKDGERGESAL